MGAISSQEVGDKHATGEVVIALLFAAPVRVVDYVEWLHLLAIGNFEPILKRELASQV